MKKFICLLIVIAFLFILCSCTSTEKDLDGNDNRLKLIFNDGYVLIYVDNETGVQYIFRSNSGACVMVDENGEPLIYDNNKD